MSIEENVQIVKDFFAVDISILCHLFQH